MNTPEPISPNQYESTLTSSADHPTDKVKWTFTGRQPQRTRPNGSFPDKPWFHAKDTITMNVHGHPDGTHGTLTFRRINGNVSALPTPFRELNKVNVSDGVYNYVTGQRLTFETDKSPVIQPIEYDWAFTLSCVDDGGKEHRFDPELQVGAGGPQKNS